MTLLGPAPLAGIATALREGRLDPVAYAADLCDRIDAIEPAIRSLLPEAGRRARLLAEAAAVRARYPDPAARPALFGVPVGVKDIFRVAGFATRAGSVLPAGLFAGAEASSVAALRRAGALILGKTVTTEFAAAEPGPTRNPHQPAHTPGGSSSGSAAAVAAGLCPLALGSQTIGSVIRPAAFCGVVGFKPSYERVPVDGVIPYAPAVDHVGLFTQDAAGMHLAASVLCRDWRDDLAARPGRRPVLGVPEGAYLRQAAPDGLAAFERQAARLAAAGYTVRRVPALGDIGAINRRHTRLAYAELAAAHRDWFAAHAGRYRPRTAALVRAGQAVAPEELPGLRAGRAALREELEEARARAGVDLWICPPAPGPASAGLDSTGDWIMNVPWTQAGLPALARPAGRGRAARRGAVRRRGGGGGR